MPFQDYIPSFTLLTWRAQSQETKKPRSVAPPQCIHQWPTISRMSPEYKLHQLKKLHFLGNLNNEYTVSPQLYQVELYNLMSYALKDFNNSHAESPPEVSPLSGLPFQDVFQVKLYQLKELHVLGDLYKECPKSLPLCLQ